MPRSICGKRLCVEEDIMDRTDSARSEVTLGGCYIPANEADVITLVPPICYYVISIMTASICMIVSWSHAICSKVSRSEAVFHLKFWMYTGVCESVHGNDLNAQCRVLTTYRSLDLYAYQRPITHRLGISRSIINAVEPAWHGRKVMMVPGYKQHSQDSARYSPVSVIFLSVNWNSTVHTHAGASSSFQNHCHSYKIRDFRFSRFSSKSTPATWSIWRWCPSKIPINAEVPEK